MILFGFFVFCRYESGVRDGEERSSSGEDGLLSSPSEEGDLRSCGEGSPIIQGSNWTEEDNWIEEPSEHNQEDGLARAVELFTLELVKLKTKMKCATHRKSSEILISVAAEVHMQLQTIESQIQTDIGKHTNLSKSKKKRLETRFEEQQEQLKVIYDKFKEQVNQHLQECRSTLEGLEVYQTERTPYFPLALLYWSCYLMELRQCSSAAVFFNHDMLLLIFGAKLKGDCEKLRSGPPQRSRQWTPRPSQFRITGSDLNGGVAAIIGELDHGDAGTRKMDAWGTWRGHSKQPSSEAGNHFFSLSIRDGHIETHQPPKPP